MNAMSPNCGVIQLAVRQQVGGSLYLELLARRSELGR